MFCEEIIELFQKIPATLPKPVGYIKKRQTLLTYVVGKWFMYKHKSKVPPMKSPLPSKKENNKEENIK